MLFLGGFKHPPNIQALEWFIKEVMPLLDLPDDQRILRVVGSHMPESVREFASEHIEAIGYVENLADVFDQARVFVAPLLFGAGVKGKVLESMAYGLPIVATSVAAEATSLVHGVNSMIADTPQQFADGIREVALSPSVWQAYREGALACVERNNSVCNGVWLLSRMLEYLDVVHLNDE